MKRILDITLSIIGIIALAPLFILIAILIKRDSEGPVFFLQERVGKDCKTFRIFKFRTMTTKQNSGSLQITVGSDSRITKIGSYLRKYKIDELPQFFNVLCGQMSLVGPRPEVQEYVNYYSQRDKDLVLSMRPGITDLASLRYCRFYAQKQSFLLDIKIMWMTVMAIL